MICKVVKKVEKESVGEKLGDSTKHEESVGYNFGDNDTKRMGYGKEKWHKRIVRVFYKKKSPGFLGKILISNFSCFYGQSWMFGKSTEICKRKLFLLLKNKLFF